MLRELAVLITLVVALSLTTTPVYSIPHGTVDFELFNDTACSIPVDYMLNRTYTDVSLDGSQCYTTTGNGRFGNQTQSYTMNCTNVGANVYYVESIWFGASSCSGSPNIVATHNGVPLACNPMTAVVNFTGGNGNVVGNGTFTLYSQLICTQTGAGFSARIQYSAVILSALIAFVSLLIL